MPCRRKVGYLKVAGIFHLIFLKPSGLPVTKAAASKTMGEGPLLCLPVWGACVNGYHPFRKLVSGFKQLAC